LPALDKLFPKDIPFTDMESRVIWTPQGIPFQYFGGMGERERTVVPRLDEDNAMFGPQFNVNLYYKDRVLEGSLENGVAGFAGQMNRARGTEQNARYLAEGAWQPHLTPKEFYAGYIRRIYGEEAEQAMLTAYEALEEHEEALGWSGRVNFNCCGVIGEVSMAYGVYRQANPFDGPVKWAGFVKGSRQRIEQFSSSIGILRKALDALVKAGPRVAPQGREEWAYLHNKTEAYILFHQTLITARRAYIAYDEAFRLRKEDYAEFLKRLDASMVLFSEARRLGRQTMEKFAEIVDHPSDMGVLYRGNLFLITGLEMVEQTMRNIVNFHHGRPYTEPVEWSRIYHDFPQFGPPR
jgi:hypothetical protein